MFSVAQVSGKVKGVICQHGLENMEKENRHILASLAPEEGSAEKLKSMFV